MWKCEEQLCFVFFNRNSTLQAAFVLLSLVSHTFIVCFVVLLVRRLQSHCGYWAVNTSSRDMIMYANFILFFTLSPCEAFCVFKRKSARTLTLRLFSCLHEFHNPSLNHNNYMCDSTVVWRAEKNAPRETILFFMRAFHKIITTHDLCVHVILRCPARAACKNKL